MIERFSKEELEQIVKELKTAGYSIDNESKAYLFQRARHDAEIPYVYEDIRRAIYDITDRLTDNYSERSCKAGAVRKMRNNHVPEDKKVMYSAILRDMLGALKPYIGRA